MNPGTKIGKYLVFGRGEQRADGLFDSSAVIRWESGGTAHERPIYFEKMCPTEVDAAQHAVREIYLRVHSGTL